MACMEMIVSAKVEPRQRYGDSISFTKANILGRKREKKSKNNKKLIQNRLEQ